MMRCIAIDDEPLALELLEDNISKLPYLQLVGSCNNAIEAIKVLQTEHVDLIFLDIQMPGLTGLQFIQSLTVKPMIILVTAYEKYALDGFNLDVVDYLVKPVSLDRFIKACNKAYELFQLRSKNNGETNNAYIFVKADYSLIKIDLEDIVWVEGLKDYLRIHLHNSNKPIVTRMAMKALEEELPSSRFVRIHKSFIVSIRFITSIRKSTLLVGEQELPIGDIYRDGVTALTGKND